jgi:nitrate reductase (cytochrome)
MSTVDRRTFLMEIALASAAAAGATAGRGAFQAAGAAVQGTVPGPVVWNKAPCPFCSVGCGLLVGVRDGRAIAVKGDTDSPVSRGLACVKGYHAAQALYGPDRLLRARIRRNGTLVDVPMYEALDLVATRLRDTIARHGSDSVGVYGSAQWSVPDRYIAAKLFRGVLGTSLIESDTGLETASGAAGLIGSFGMDGAAGCYDDIDFADVIVLWNHNIAESDPVLFSRILERRRTNPAVRIIDMTTRMSRTSYAADRTLVYTPRTEIALANAVCHEIVSRGWSNEGFIKRHVAFRRGEDDIGYGMGDDPLVSETAAGADHTAYVRFLADYSPDRVESVSGIAASDIRWLASLYGDRSRRVMSVWGAGINRQARGTWINNTLYNIHLLTGRIATPGNGALCTTGAADACAAVECGGRLTPADGSSLAATDQQRALAARLWGMDEARINGQSAPGILPLFRKLEDGDLRFLWIQGTDPLRSLPNLQRYRAATARADRFIVVSDAYPTPTADAADVVLPTAFWIEREGITGNSERRVQHFDRMLSPPGDAMDVAWQMIEVARRLGAQRLFPWAPGRHVEASWDEYARFHAAASRRLPPIAELRARPGLVWPFVDGRETRWRYSTGRDPAADARRGEFDFYGHADHRAWIWLRPHQPPAESPNDEYPFWLTTGVVLEHDVTATATRRVPTLHRAMPKACAHLNAQDAAQLGIRSGERVRLITRRGQLEIDACIDQRTRPARGSVFVPHFDEALPINLLTLDASCPLSGQPDSACAVRVERITARSAT